MLNHIIQRRHRSSGYNDTEIEVLKAATRLFLEKGFSNTTLKMIADEAGLKVGHVNYYYRAKEDILYLIIEELMIFHSSIIERVLEETDDCLFSYATEIALQIALCDENEVARDLYSSAYTIPGVLAIIKDWGCKKNMVLFKDRLSHWSEQDFKNKENVTTYIELAAIKTDCEPGFTLEDKVSLILENMLTNYEVPKDECREVISKILSSDYKYHAQDVFSQFVERFEKSAEEFNK